MIRRLGCPCGGKLRCKLCSGAGVYDYEVGPRGWMPFVCPTCSGTGRLVEPGQPDEECPTCHWTGTVDPANAPVTFLGKIRKMFFGG